MRTAQNTNTPTTNTPSTKTLAARRLAAGAAALLVTATLTLSGLTPRALHADPTDGQRSQDTFVRHGYDDVYRVKYDGGQEGDVHVRAADDADDQYLEVKVYDPHGTLVTRDFGAVGHSPVCAWRVGGGYEWRQYTIKVVNLSYHHIPYNIHFF